jgi:hypothetical protein
MGGKKKMQEEEYEGKKERTVPAALSMMCLSVVQSCTSAARYSFQKNVLSEGIYPVYLQFCPEQQ